MTTVGHIHIAPEEQDVGKDGKPRQEEGEQPKRGTIPVHPTDHPQVEREGLTDRHEEPAGDERSWPDLAQTLARVRRQPVDQEEGERRRQVGEREAGDLAADPRQHPGAEIGADITLDEERRQGRA